MPASQQSFTQWQMTTPYGVEGAGNDVTVMHGPGPFFRDGLDMLRSAQRTPEANYPDGYLGTIHTRRGDRLLDNLQRRQSERSYTRGVHKGERIDQSDYFWPDDFDMRGLQLEARGQKFAPVGAPITTLVNDGKVSRAALGILETNPAVASKLAHLRPPWA